MQYDPERHHRRSIRLRGYDYAQAGFYFVTACVQDRACLLGKIVKGDCDLSAAGEMVARWWEELPVTFADVETDAFVIMPNHMHGIVFIGTGQPTSDIAAIEPGGPMGPPV